MDSRDSQEPRRLKRSRLKAQYDRLLPAYEQALAALREEVRRQLDSRGLRPAIKHRVKRFEDYFAKLHRTRRQGPAGAAVCLTDVLGLRIICPFLEDVDQVVALLAGTFEVVELERRGAGQSYREFAYDSVHMLVKVEDDLLPKVLPHTEKVCELQLRTILQDAWAEVEHELIYKSDITLPNESARRKLAALNANLTLADLIFQEIRDQQRELRERSRKRRRSVAAGFSPPEFPVLPHLLPVETGRGKPSAPESVSLTGASRLEKALIEALQAHSGEDLETAIRLYTQILRRKIADSIRSLVYNHRGMARFALFRHTEALGDFTRAIRLDPRNARAYTNRALAYRVLNEHTRAVSDFDRALKIDPCCLDALWGRAQALCDLELHSRALADCEETLTLRPDFTPARALSQRIRRRTSSPIRSSARSS